MNQNVQAVLWANTYVRPLADQLYSTYLTCKKFKQMADAQQIFGAAKPIPNDATLLGDGSAVDGRPPMTDAQATNLYNRAVDVINWYEGSAAISTSDGSFSVGNTVTNVSVNGSARF